jgi:hypothetical protein
MNSNATRSGGWPARLSVEDSAGLRTGANPIHYSIVAATVQIPYSLNLLGLAMVVGAATLVVTRLESKKIAPNLATGSIVTISSRHPSSPDPSHVVDGDIYQLGFHTNLEQNPWVLLDLGREKLVHHIIFYNRADCCQERAVPLVIQLSHDGQKFTDVSRIDKRFNKWDAEIPAQSARYIRATTPKFEFLHLSEIEVR